MAELTKRFISGTYDQWFGENGANKTTNEGKYANSIVFIKNNTDPTKGDMIFAQGAYFEMNNEKDVQSIIDSHLLEGSNITFTEGTNGELVINATGLTSLKGLAGDDTTSLVTAQAVAGALTTPFSLEADIAVKQDKLDERISYRTATFTQNFTNLKEETVQAQSSVLVEGDNVTFSTYKETDGSVVGVEISADDTLYKMTSENYEFYVPGTEELVNGVGIDLHSGVNGEFDIKPGFSGDAGSITIIGDNKNITVERLEGNADIIKISADLDGLKEGLNYAGKENNPVVVDNTTREIYHAAAAVTRTEDGEDLSSDNKSFTVPTYSFDEFGHVQSEVTTTVTLPETAFKDTTYGATDGITLDTATNTFKHTNVVEGVSLANAEMAKQTPTSTSPTFTFKTYGYDDHGHILGSKDATVELPATAFSDENTQYTITTTTTTDATNSVDVNLVNSDTDNVSSKVAIKGGNNVAVSQDGQGVITVSSANVTVRKKDGTTDDQYVYEILQGDTVVGTINHPKELVVTNGRVFTAEEDNSELNIVKGEKYLELTIANQTTPVYIAVKDLVDVYTEGNGIAISDSNEVSVKLHEGEKYLAFDEDKCLVSTGIDTAIGNVIADLDSEKTGEGTNVSVTVTQTDGLITAVAVSDDTVNKTEFEELKAEVEENEETTAGALTDLDGRLIVVEEFIGGLNVGVTSVAASTSSAHVTVAPTTAKDGAVTVTVDVASVDATDKAAYVAKGLATDAYVDEEIDTAIKALDSSATGTVGAVTVSEGESAENYVNVVKGFTVTQTDGKLASTATVVDERIYSTKYIDDKLTPGVVTLTNTDAGDYLFTDATAGFVTAKNMADIMNEAWAWGSI